MHKQWMRGSGGVTQMSMSHSSKDADKECAIFGDPHKCYLQALARKIEPWLI